jgi:hypothetical protein
MYDTIHTPDYFSDLQYLTNGAAQGAAGDVPLPGLAQLLLFTLSIHGNTRPAQYGIAYKKSQCFLAIILITEVFTSLSECGKVKASTYAR